MNATDDSQSRAHIQAAAQRLAQTQVELDAAKKRAADACADLDGLAARIEALQQTVLSIRQAAEGRELSDVQAGRVHAATLDEADLQALMAEKSRAAAQLREQQTECELLASQAANGLSQARAQVRATALRGRIQAAELAFCSLVIEAFKAHTTAGGSAHFPHFWQASDVLRSLAYYGQVPR